MDRPPHPVDILIVGGGISGLWLLTLLRSRGYSCLLVERGRLGGQQTLASQGILHGGVKYALDGVLNGASVTIGAMPARWQRCLEGVGEIDLSSVTSLTRQQWLWTTGHPGSRLAALVGSRVMRGRIEPSPAGSHPAPFDSPHFAGALYRLHETVLDIPSLIHTLAASNSGRILRPTGGVRLHSAPDGISLECDDRRFTAQRVLLAAGSGNGPLLSSMERRTPQMQLRPLHMVMVRGRLPSLYGHCLGVGATPRLTITSHPLAGSDEAERVWYIGGEAAESGVVRDSQAQVMHVMAELKETLPWIPLQGCDWATFRVDRAEFKTPSGGRPDGVAVAGEGRVITLWPTKLVLAPALGDELLTQLRNDGVTPRHIEAPLPPEICPATPGVPPWVAAFGASHRPSSPSHLH